MKLGFELLRMLKFFFSSWRKLLHAINAMIYYAVFSGRMQWRKVCQQINFMLVRRDIRRRIANTAGYYGRADYDYADLFCFTECWRLSMITAKLTISLLEWLLICISASCAPHCFIVKTLLHYASKLNAKRCLWIDAFVGEEYHFVLIQNL